MNKRRLAFDTFNVGRQEERTRLGKTAHKGFDNGLSPIYSEDILRHDLDLFCWYLPETWENSPERIGTPAVTISTEDCPIKPEWLLKPLIHKGQPTLIFADGGSGKSIFGEVIATTVSLAWLDNPLKMVPYHLPVKVLYLDWETDEEELRWRLCALKEGMNVPRASFLYRPCRSAFHIDAERIERIVRTENVGLIVVDSLGGACGADLKEAEAANQYFRAMRAMSCASLTLTHVTKESKGEGKTATPFGSAYFANWARSVWEIKKRQEDDDDSLTIGLFHRKANNSRKFKPIGFKLNFLHVGDDLREVSLKRIDLEADPALAKDLPIPMRILGALKRGERSRSDILTELDVKEGSLDSALSRMRGAGKIIQRGDNYALPAEVELEPEVVPF